MSNPEERTGQEYLGFYRLVQNAERVRCSLVNAFAYHPCDLSPQGDPNATPDRIATHTDEFLVAACALID